MSDIDPNETSWHQIPPCTEEVETIYRDEHLWMVNKPTFLLSVPGRGPHKQDCVLKRLQNQEPEVKMVHRLDLDTSGLMIFAIGKASQSELGRIFQRRQVKKTYEAVLQGIVEKDEGEIDFPIIADWERRPRQKICYETGKPSLTYFKVIERLTDKDATYVQLHPHTGRSHQLRIHSLNIGHPIIGCDLYAPIDVLKRSPRLLLHATELTFPHPISGEEMTFQCPSPFREDWASR